VGRFWGLIVLAAVVVLGAAGTSGAASPSITVCPSPASGTLTCGSTPGNGVTVPYFTDSQPTYISYTVAFRRGSDNNTLTHARVSDPVGSPLGSCGATTAGCPDARFAGANVVDLLGTVAVGASPATTFCTMSNAVFRYPTTTADPLHREGVTCPLGSLAPNSTVVLTVVFRVPKQADAGGATALVNQAALFVDESLNDSQPSSSHQDTFPTTSVTNPLTADVTNGFNTYTLPNTSGSFQTGSGGTGNYQQSAVSWSGTTGFLGGGLLLLECGGPGLACGGGISSPCPGVAGCTTQTSVVLVPGSEGSFFTQNPMTITLTFFASELPAKFNLSQFVIYHDGFPVSSCKARTLTDPKLDCLLSLTQSKTPPLDVTAVITGPANGGWGGI
jgi:hypothetical protein